MKHCLCFYNFKIHGSIPETYFPKLLCRPPVKHIRIFKMMKEGVKQKKGVVVGELLVRIGKQNCLSREWTYKGKLNEAGIMSLMLGTVFCQFQLFQLLSA